LIAHVSHLHSTPTLIDVLIAKQTVGINIHPPDDLLLCDSAAFCFPLVGVNRSHVQSFIIIHYLCGDKVFWPLLMARSAKQANLYKCDPVVVLLDQIRGGTPSV